jgi:hypothetical protein
LAGMPRDYRGWREGSTSRRVAACRARTSCRRRDAAGA